MKKILITGSMGFIGSHLSEELVSQGQEVFALVRDRSKRPPGVNVIYGELTPDKNHWEWIDKLPHDLDIVIHAAGLVHSHRNSDFFDVNTNSTKIFIQELKRKYDTKQITFVLLSSLAALYPVSEYGKSKLMAELVLTDTPNSWKKHVIRPPMVIGPRDDAILSLIRMVSKGHYFSPGINGDKKCYSFICVFDLVQSIVKIAFSHFPNHVHYPAHPDTITYKELLLSIGYHLKVKRLRKLIIPTCLIQPMAHTISFLARIFPPMRKLRLSADKSKEILKESWISPMESQFVYKWNLQKTIEVTVNSFEERVFSQ